MSKYDYHPHVLSVPYSLHKKFGAYRGFVFETSEEYLKKNVKAVVYQDVFWPHLFTDKRYDIWIGGNGSGKSTNKAKQLLYKALDSSKYTRVLFVRINQKDIEKSVYQMFKDVARVERIESYFKFYDGSCDIECRPTGNLLFSSGLYDTGKLSGISDITDIWVEEPITIANRKVSMITKEDFDNLNTRLRTPFAANKLHMTLNPISKNFFLYSELLDPDIKPKDRVYNLNDFNVCNSTYLDNPYLTEEYKTKVIETFTGKRAMYGRLGEWPDEVTGGEWLPSFDRTKHVKPTTYVTDAPVHEGHDFNMLPYQTAIFLQIIRSTKDNRLKVRVFKEYCGEPPNNVQEYGTKRFIEDFIQPYGYNSIYIYGDASGKYGTDSFRPIFATAAHYLANDSDQVMKRNPYLATARDLMNEILEGKYGIDFQVDPSCRNLIKDLSTLQTAPDGFDKEKDKNGVEKKGHCYSALTYIICKIFSHLLKENL